MKSRRRPPQFFALLALLAPATKAETIRLSASEVSAAVGDVVEVPISIQGAERTGPIGFVIEFDPFALEAIADPPGVEPYGVVLGETGNGLIETDASQSGKLAVGLVTKEAIKSDGILVIARFNVLESASGNSTIFVNRAEAWEDETGYEVNVEANHGAIAVTADGGNSIAVWLALLAAFVAIFVVFLILRNRQPRDKPRSSPQKEESAEAGASAIEKLKELKQLLEDELITQADFDEQKKKLLGEL